MDVAEDLKKVKRNGLALEYVENQTPEICLAAVQQNGLALQFVKEQTPELCLAAVQQYGFALGFAREQTAPYTLIKSDHNTSRHYSLVSRS